MGRGTSLGYLIPLGKFSASLGRVGWKALSEQCGTASRKSKMGLTVRCRVKSVFGKRWWIKKLDAWAASK